MPFASLKEVYGDDFVTITQQNTQQPNFQYKSLYNGKLDELETSPETENINKEIESFVSDYSNGLESYENTEPYYSSYCDKIDPYDINVRTAASDAIRNHSGEYSVDQLLDIYDWVKENIEYHTVP